MKQISQVVLIFFTVFLLYSYSITAARLLPPHQGEQLVKTKGITHAAGSSIEVQEGGLFHLLGLEECDDKDEDCTERRMVAEAHLDYIYTQHHKPKGSP